MNSPLFHLDFSYIFENKDAAQTYHSLIKDTDVENLHLQIVALSYPN